MKTFKQYLEAKDDERLDSPIHRYRLARQDIPDKHKSKIPAFDYWNRNKYLQQDAETDRHLARLSLKGSEDTAARAWKDMGHMADRSKGLRGGSAMLKKAKEMRRKTHDPLESSPTKHLKITGDSPRSKALLKAYKYIYSDPDLSQSEKDKAFDDIEKNINNKYGYQSDDPGFRYER
jgi:hypothetical protein